MPSLEQMANKGERKYRNKLDIMESNYADSKNRAVQNYRDLPFGPNTTNAYESGMSDAEQTYRESMDSSKADKWKRNWQAKMRQ